MRYRNTVFNPESARGKTEKQFLEFFSKHSAFKGVTKSDREDTLKAIYKESLNALGVKEEPKTKSKKKKKDDVE